MSPTKVSADDVRRVFWNERVGHVLGRHSVHIGREAIANFGDLTSGFEGVDELKGYEESSDVYLRERVELAPGFEWEDLQELPSVAMTISASLFGRLSTCRGSSRVSHRSSLVSEEEDG